MNTTTFTKHFCLDAYKGDYAKLADAKGVSRFLTAVCDKFFSGHYFRRTISCLGNYNPNMDGISGVILGGDSHFTVHTFSNVNAVFVDYHGKKVTAVADKLPMLLKEHFGTRQLDIRIEKSQLPGHFGRHIVFERQSLSFVDAIGLKNQIIEVINMTPLGPDFSLQSEDGFDVIQPIAESHISIHQSYGQPAWIDIFSCRYFDDTEIWQLVGAKPKVEIQRGVFLPPDWKE